MTFVKLEDAEAKLEALQITGLLYSSDVHYNSGLEDAVKALRSLPTDDGVTDEMVERASKAVIDAANWRNMRGIDEGSPLWGEKVARAALQAALGPLPAPPSD